MQELGRTRWDRVFSATCLGFFWQLRQDTLNLARLEAHTAEADQGVAPVIVMLPFRGLVGGDMSRREISCSMDTQMSVKHARSGDQACTMRRFLVTTDAEIALMSS